MEFEGRLRIRLETDGAVVRGVQIHSSRQLQASRAFHGKMAEEALLALPLLFSVCGTAQAVAGVRAVEGALGLPLEPATERLREVLVRLETLREHLWHVFLRWPVFLGEKPATGLAGEVHRLQRQAIARLPAREALQLGARLESLWDGEGEIATGLNSLVREVVLGEPPESWLERNSEAALLAWIEASDTLPARLLRLLLQQQWQGVGRAETAPLPPLPGSGLKESIEDPGFLARPVWEGRCRETGSLARTRHPLLSALEAAWGRGLGLRLVARLVELAQLLTRPEAASCEMARPAPGLGRVEAARGRLHHAVKLQGNRVTHWAILAPTEWNFHPRGVAAQALSGLRGAPDEIRRQAELVIDAVDPCVRYDLEVG